MFDENGNPNDIGITKIIYSGYQNHCINKDIEATLSFEDFSRLVDDLAVTPEGLEELKVIIKSWSESTDIQKLVKDTGEKKSLTEDPTTLMESENLESDPGKLEDTPSES